MYSFKFKNLHSENRIFIGTVGEQNDLPLQDFENSTDVLCI